MLEPYKKRTRLAAMLVGIAILVFGAAISILRTASEPLPQGESSPLTDNSQPESDPALEPITLPNDAVPDENK